MNATQPTELNATEAAYLNQLARPEQLVYSAAFRGDIHGAILAYRAQTSCNASAAAYVLHQHFPEVQGF